MSQSFPAFQGAISGDRVPERLDGADLMESIVTKILEISGDNWCLLTAVMIWLAFYFHFDKDAWRETAERKRLIGRLAQDRFLSKYQRGLSRVLDALDQRLSGLELERGHRPSRIAFSNGLIQIAMLWAVAYPISLLALQWLSGSALYLGGTEIAPPGTIWQRLFLTLCWTISGFLIFALFKAQKTSYRWQFPLLICAIGSLFGGIVLASQINIPLAVATASAFASAGAVAPAVTSASTFAFAFSGAITFAVAGLVAFAGAVASAGVVAYAVASAFAGVVASASAVAFLSKESGRNPFIWVVYLIFWIIGLAVLFSLVPSATTPPTESKLIVLLLGAFPLFNSLADYISIGMTRYWLRRGLEPEQSAFKCALADLGLGALVFAALGCAMILFIDLARFGDGTALFSLDGLFQDLAKAPQDYWWLLIMLGSTLLPTLLHAALAFWTLLISHPEKLRTWIATRLHQAGQGYPSDGKKALAVYCGLKAFAAWAILEASYQLLTFDHAIALRGVIWLFHGFAWLTGAVEQPPVWV